MTDDDGTSGIAEGDDRPTPTLADKLNRLFELHPADRGPYTNEEVASAIAARGGPTISASYLWLLRTGRRSNPTAQHLTALAKHFGVSVAYFFDDDKAQQIYDEIPKLAALRDPDIQKIALRAYGLSPGMLSAVTALIEQLRREQDLPEPEPEPEPQPEEPLE